MTLQNARGTRDIPPAEALQRQKMADTLRSVFARYGYLPLETPVLERFDVLASKYAGGAEILKETFRLSDQGKRELALRYDLTVPMCRFIAMHPTLKLPFKRYQIAPVFRDGPIKLGRYRQFTQCDVDVVGSSSMRADAELLMVARHVFQRLNLPVTIHVNNRKLLNSVIAAAGVPADKTEDAILSLDKLAKVGKEAVMKELAGKGIGAAAAKKLFVAMTAEGSNNRKLKHVSTFLKNAEGEEGLAEMQSLLSFVGNRHVVFAPELARGLAYYTGTVFEVFLKRSTITSAVAAGGRYDGMIGSFVGAGSYPAVGISFGLDVIMDALQPAGAQEQTTTRAYVIPIKAEKKAAAVAEQLRADGINTDIDLVGRSISKNLNYANAQGIPFVVFVGEKELRHGKVKLRDMKTGEEKLMSTDNVIASLRSS